MHTGGSNGLLRRARDRFLCCFLLQVSREDALRCVVEVPATGPLGRWVLEHPAGLRQGRRVRIFSARSARVSCPASSLERPVELLGRNRRREQSFPRVDLRYLSSSSGAVPVLPGALFCCHRALCLSRMKNQHGCLEFAACPRVGRTAYEEHTHTHLGGGTPQGGSRHRLSI